MTRRLIDKIFCQNCRTANPVFKELCAQCGTRLMLVSSTNVARHEEPQTRHIPEEHLLERISVLENSFGRLTDRVGDVLDLLMKHSQSLYFDHTLLETLIVLLCEAGQINPLQLKTEWEKRRQNSAGEDGSQFKLAAARQKIMTAFAGRDLSAFSELIDDGFALLAEDKTQPAMRIFEKSVLLDEGNAPLHLLIGRHYYGENKFALARAYLEQTIKAETANAQIFLLLGMICHETGDEEDARRFLDLTGRVFDSSFALNAVRGRLSAIDGRWAEALKFFKMARTARPGVAGEYLLGAAYYARGYDRAALRCLQKALEGDFTGHAEIYALTALVLRRLGRRKEAGEFQTRAAALDPKKFAARSGGGRGASREKRGILTAEDFLIINPPAKLARQVFWAEAIVEDALALTGFF